MAAYLARQKIIPFQSIAIVKLFQSINKQAFEEIKAEPKEQILNVKELLERNVWPLRY